MLKSTTGCGREREMKGVRTNTVTVVGLHIPHTHPLMHLSRPFHRIWSAAGSSSRWGCCSKVDAGYLHGLVGILSHPHTVPALLHNAAIRFGHSKGNNMYVRSARSNHHQPCRPAGGSNFFPAYYYSKHHRKRNISLHAAIVCS